MQVSTDEQPYCIKFREVGGVGSDIQIWRGKRRIADINAQAFRSRDCELAEAGKFVAALNSGTPITAASLYQAIDKALNVIHRDPTAAAQFLSNEIMGMPDGDIDRPELAAPLG